MLPPRRDPVDPQTSAPCTGIDDGHGEDAPLLGLPAGIEPERLPQHAEHWSPLARTLSSGLGEAGRQGAQQGNCDLIKAHCSNVRDTGIVIKFVGNNAAQLQASSNHS